MFEMLKNKIGAFISNIAKKEKQVIKKKPQQAPIKKIPKKQIKSGVPAKEKKIVKKNIIGKVRALISKKVKIEEKDVAQFFDELKISLLESDVSLDTTDYIIDKLRKNIVGKEFDKNKIDEEIKTAIKKILEGMLIAPPDFFSLVKNKSKPIIILFLGPNGTGKTTTIAKLVYLLKKHSISSVIAASDTFRAAALEQLEKHANTLNVKLIKHKYGADPSAVAFDAIQYAKAHNIDVVLVDTAGRQETNYNLLKEMEKINRVVKPDFKIFVGEAIAGHALVDQIKKFKEDIGVDFVILTKIDCDAKGGNTFSISHDLNIPVLFVGTGENYPDLAQFKPSFVVNKLL